MEKTLKLSILMPVFNEKYYVEEVVDAVLRAPLPPGVERELIVVDDCSTDGTRELLSSMAKSNPAIRLLLHDVNRGKGASIRTALQHATGDVVVTQDSDLEYNPADYQRMLGPILAGEADAVYGSRFLVRDARRILLFWHMLGNKLLTLLANLFSNLNLTDMETGYKMVRASILKSIPLRCNRFGIEPEVTMKLAKRGCRIFEVPVYYRGRTYEEGKKITWLDGVKAVFIILFFWLVDDIYDQGYGRQILHSLSGVHRFNRWMADTIRPWVGEEVLEIGAGLGNLTIKLLPRKRYVVSDVDPLFLDYLGNAFRHNRRVSVEKVDVVAPSDFDKLAGRFDTVVCLNVVEHVEDDRLAFRNILSALVPGGRACILVPRGPRLFGQLDVALGHFRRYEEKDLRAKLAEAGFEVEKVFTFNRVAVPGWYVNARILKRNTFSKVQLKILDSSVWLWSRIDRFLPWQGVSLTAIARKPAAR